MSSSSSVCKVGFSTLPLSLIECIYICLDIESIHQLSVVNKIFINVAQQTSVLNSYSDQVIAAINALPEKYSYQGDKRGYCFSDTNSAVVQQYRTEVIKTAKLNKLFEISSDLLRQRTYNNVFQDEAAVNFYAWALSHDQWAFIRWTCNNMSVIAPRLSNSPLLMAFRVAISQRSERRMRFIAKNLPFNIKEQLPHQIDEIRKILDNTAADWRPKAVAVLCHYPSMRDEFNPWKEFLFSWYCSAAHCIVS